VNATLIFSQNQVGDSVYHFCNIWCFTVTSSTLRLKDRHLSAIHDCSFIIFTATVTYEGRRLYTTHIISKLVHNVHNVTDIKLYTCVCI